MENGTALKYVKRHPECDVLELVGGPILASEDGSQMLDNWHS